MLNKKLFTYFLILVTFLFCMPAYAADVDLTQAQDSLRYSVLIQNDGWQNDITNGQIAGTEGQAKGLESIIINDAAPITYEAYVSDIGWNGQRSNGQEAGEAGHTIEAIRIGSSSDQFDVYYRVHSKDFGWLGWTTDNNVAGTTDCAFPIEAIQIAIVSPGAVPGDTAVPYVQKDDLKLNVRAHLTNVGWTDAPANSGVAGTTGQGTPIEALEMTVTDPTGKSRVDGQALIKDLGWESNRTTNFGTTGLGLPIEAVRLSLGGPIADIYDLNYQAHVSNLGWLPATSDYDQVDSRAGSENADLPMEAMQYDLVKNHTGESNDGSFRSVDIPLGIVPPAPTCIVINKAAQRMAFYKDYNVAVNTNIVTGMQRIDDTHAGDFTVLTKESPFHTYGPGYDAWTDYWLTLYNGDIYGFNGEGHKVDKIGIHDAAWRSDWSSRAYTYNGSHGCVNTPYSAMKYIFENSEVGTPVRIR